VLKSGVGGGGRRKVRFASVTKSQLREALLFYLYFICYVLLHCHLVSFFNSLLSYFRSFSCFPSHDLRRILFYSRISSSFELSVFKTHLYSTHRWAEHSDQYAYSLHFIHANKHVEVHVCSSGIANTFTVYSKSDLSKLLDLFLFIYFSYVDI
jgi:hypothetical protein